MCGIAGLIGYEDQLRAIKSGDYEKMRRTMGRRGPDQSGAYYSKNAVLLHSRLSVIDPQNGRQPMTAGANGNTYTIVYNGELYNTQEVRDELKLADFSFDSRSDTEVLLKAYIAWGEACLRKLNGIFAFAVWDEAQERLFIARDPMGVKPFFYTISGGVFLFASEIKTLLSSSLVTGKIDLDSVREIMLIGPGRTPGYGVFKNIFELAPGECGIFNRSGLNKQTYWQVEDAAHTNTFNQTVKKVRFLIKDAITRQLVSDVPIGAFLSGGLDSGIIAALAARAMAERGETLPTFSVYYEDNEKYFRASKFQPNSDTNYIEIMRQYLGSEHHRIVIGTDALVDALYEAVIARDLPGMADIDSSLLLFCREVKKVCTVALSGECADEIFGGYPWFRDKSIRETEGFPWAQSTAWRQGFLRPELAAQIDAPAYVMQRYRETVARTGLLTDNSAEDRSAKIMMNLNMQWFMQTLLDRKDRMSMYSGLEVRVPFCDYRIAQYLYTVPWAIKEHQGFEKGLLREAARGWLPDEILWRKKSPYPKTHHPAYLNAVTAQLQDLIASPNEPLFDLVQPDKLTELIRSENPQPWYGQLMTVPQTIAYFLQLNYWLKEYQIKITL
jgi:asparagine synthase (glutamine-hydrolysing)